MGLLDLFKKKASTPQKLSSTSLDVQLYRELLYNWGLGRNQMIYDPDNKQGYIDNGYLYNADIYAIIKRISKTAATCPFILQKVSNKNEATKYMALTRHKNFDLTRMEALRNKAFVPVENSPILDILRQPNPEQSGFEFFENHYGFLLLTGNSYIFGAGPDAGQNQGKFMELYMLPSHKMIIVSGGIMEPVQGYRLMYLQSQIEIPANKILHSREWTPDYNSPASHLYGLSPLRAASLVLQRGNDAVTASMNMFKNAGPPGILFSEDSAAPFTDEQQQAFEDLYRSKYMGPNKSNIPILTSAKLSWQQMGLSPVDLEIIEAEKMNLRTLCNIFGLSSTLFNDPENKTFNNLIEAKKELISNAVMPLLCRTRDDLNRWLVKPYYPNGDVYLDFDLSVYPELSEDLNHLTTMLNQAWWMTPNERRERMGLQPATQVLMNNYYLPNNLVNIEDLEAVPGLDYQTVQDQINQPPGNPKNPKDEIDPADK